MSIHISKSNSKLGKIGSFSTTPIVGCGENCKVCMGKCYARKSYRMYPSVRKACDENLDAVQNDRKAILDAVVSYCNGGRKPKTAFRWFVSGDIPDRDFVFLMCRIANDCPNTRFLCFTKSYDAVTSYVWSGHCISDNLTIVFSRWDGLGCNNPINFPESDVILRGTEKEQTHNSHVCPAVKGSGITCDTCQCDCWHMERGETVYFMEH